MRILIIIMLFSLIYTVSCKNNVKALTESMGQEVIEIGTPIKELPMGLEEEPSAENDDDDKDTSTSNTVQTATKKDSKKTTTLADLKKTEKDAGKLDAITQDDEEARIEKELADIYKDTADYKSDSAEEKDVAKELQSDSNDDVSPEDADKPIARQKTAFKFEPNSHSNQDIERFRTSIDDISCGNRQKLSGTSPPKLESNKAFNTVTDALALISAILCYTFLCN